MGGFSLKRFVFYFLFFAGAKWAFFDDSLAWSIAQGLVFGVAMVFVDKLFDRFYGKKIARDQQAKDRIKASVKDSK